MNRFGITTLLLLPFCLSAVAPAQTDVTFMTFNIWNGGTSVTNGMSKIRDVVAAVKPDVVGFEEVTSSTFATTLTGALSGLGMTYYGSTPSGGDVGIISKYPITGSTFVSGSSNAVAAFTIDVNGNSVVVICGHLDYTYYACYLPRGYNGSDPNWNLIDDGHGNPSPVIDTSAILTYNRKALREKQVAAIVNYAASLTSPIVVLGDFNEPSCLDWTANTASMFDHHGVILQWPCSRKLIDSGFVDAYRERFPSEVANPGISWPSLATGMGSTSWTPKADERDRIDFIYHKGSGITTKSAALVGPKESYAMNVLTTSSTANELFLADTLAWPSDHKALLATLTFATITGAKDLPIEPSTFGLLGNYPNPFNPTTTIQYTVGGVVALSGALSSGVEGRYSHHITLAVYDLLGREVAVLVNERKAPGNYEVMFDASILSSGMYFCRLAAGGYLETKRMMVLK